MTSFYEEIQRKDSISDVIENEQSRKNVDKWIFRLLMFLIGFMPLVVLANVEEVVSPLISNIELLSSGMKGDLFTHYKSLLVILVTIITGVMLLVKVLFMDGTIRKTKLNYVLGAFIVAIVVSTVSSPNITIALNGQYNRSDGAISWLCYVALMFIAMNIEYPKNIVRYIMYTMMPFVYINLYIITMNFYGKDLMQQAWMQKLVSITLPEGATISTGSQLVGTLNQWNYMSGMFAMMTIMYLTWAILNGKNLDAIVGAITASISIIIMFMSISTSGFLTVIVVLPFIILGVFFSKNKLQSIIVLIIFFTLTIPIYGVLANKDERIWNDSFGIFTNSNPFVGKLEVSVLNGKNVYASEKVLEVPILPESNWSAGSGRLYIWEKTMDLVKSNAIIGYGADSLMYNFPHYNIDARAGMYDENTITDKVHNGFLSLLYGFGVVALVSFLVIILYILRIVYRSIKKLRWSQYILGCASLGYFIQALFNDSLPGITSVIFIIIGILISISFDKDKENVEYG